MQIRATSGPDQGHISWVSAKHTSTSSSSASVVLRSAKLLSHGTAHVFKVDFWASLVMSSKTWIVDSQRMNCWNVTSTLYTLCRRTVPPSPLASLVMGSKAWKRERDGEWGWEITSCWPWTWLLMGTAVCVWCGVLMRLYPHSATRLKRQKQTLLSSAIRVRIWFYLSVPFPCVTQSDPLFLF